MNPLWVWLIGGLAIGTVAVQQYRKQQAQTAPLPTVYAPQTSPPPPNAASLNSQAQEKAKDDNVGKIEDTTGDSVGDTFAQGDIRRFFPTKGVEMPQITSPDTPAFAGGLSLPSSAFPSGSFVTGLIPGSNPGGLPVGLTGLPLIPGSNPGGLAVGGTLSSARA